MFERLVVIPEADPQKAGRFTGRLECTGELIVSGSRQPLVDGARELIARGLDPATPLTMRHQGVTYDSFRAAPIGEWAKWTYHEGEKRSMTRARWMPFADMTGAQKSGSQLSLAPESHLAEVRLYGRPPWRHGDTAASAEAA